MTVGNFKFNTIIGTKTVLSCPVCHHSYQVPVSCSHATIISNKYNIKIAILHTLLGNSPGATTTYFY